jgi:hypothetical protein
MCPWLRDARSTATTGDSEVQPPGGWARRIGPAALAAGIWGGEWMVWREPRAGLAVAGAGGALWLGSGVVRIADANRLDRGSRPEPKPWWPREWTPAGWWAEHFGFGLDYDHTLDIGPNTREVYGQLTGELLLGFMGVAIPFAWMRPMPSEASFRRAAFVSGPLGAVGVYLGSYGASEAFEP